VMVLVRNPGFDFRVDPDVRSLQISDGRLRQVQYQDAIGLFDGYQLIKGIKVESPCALVDERLYGIRRFQCLAMEPAVDLPEQENEPISFRNRVHGAQMS